MGVGRKTPGALLLRESDFSSLHTVSPCREVSGNWSGLGAANTPSPRHGFPQVPPVGQGTARKQAPRKPSLWHQATKCKT